MHILLVRPRLIGDVVFTTPAVRALRRRFPDAVLTYLVEPLAAPVVARNPHLDEVIVAPRPTGFLRFGADVKLGRRLRAMGFDLVVDFHGGPRSSFLTWATGAPTRIGYTVTARSWMYTQRVGRSRALRPRHSVQNQWDLLTPLGIDPPDPARDPTEMPEDPQVAASVAERLAAQGVHRGHRLVVVHVSAGNPFRRWPLTSFEDFVARLAEGDGQRRIVLTSGPSDDGAGARVAEAVQRRAAPAARERVIHCGEFDLTELRSLVQIADLFVGGDSGPLHIAGTTSTPIVGLYGPTLAARSAPWRSPAFVSELLEVEGLPCRPCNQRRCVPGDFRCLGRLTPDIVWQAAERALARGGTRTLESVHGSSPNP
jgi:lipopolysaccharide heptosyltransferase II